MDHEEAEQPIAPLVDAAASSHRVKECCNVVLASVHEILKAER